jgi:ribonuclease HI
LEGEYNERLKIFTDGSLKDERVGYAIVIPETTIKNRMRSQTTVFSTEQEAIIKAIFISKGKGATVIATDSLSTMMAVRDGQKTQRRDE